MNLKIIIKNVGANSLTMGIIMLFRLLSVPVFIKFWGVDLYGEWIVLNALTAYFAMTDIGLNTATANMVSCHYVNKEFQKCDTLINNNIFFIIATFLLLFMVLLGINELNILSNLFQFKLISNKTLQIGTFLLFGQVFVGILNNLLSTIYRATNYFAKGVMIDNVIRIAENSVLLFGVAANLSILSILLLGLIVKVFGILFKFFDSRKYYKFSIGFQYVRYNELKQIFIPSISFFTYPIANSFSFQGYTLVINFILGSAAVVVFNTTRTLVNFIRTGIEILHNSVWPELSLAFGKQDKSTMRVIHRYTLLTSFTIAILSSVFLGLFGRHIYLIWTGYKIEFDSLLFYLFILAILSNTLWSSSAVILNSTNNHKGLSFLYLSLTILTFGIATLVVSLSKTISFIPIFFILMDLLLSNYVIKKSLFLTDDSLSGFTKSVFRVYNVFTIHKNRR